MGNDRTWQARGGGALVIVLVLSLLTAGCSWLPFGDQTPEPATPTISPVLEVTENYYVGVVPYKPNQTRGMLVDTHYGIDFSHLELGLTEVARETFDPGDYLFQEGQVISREQVQTWLKRGGNNLKAGQDPLGLNPSKGPLLLLHILEHDYLDKETQQLAGMVLGLTLSPVYHDAAGAEKQYTTDELRAKGQQLAVRIVQTVRAANVTVPMVIALYQVPDEHSTLIPGRFIMTGTVNAGENGISKWQPIEEEYYLFPSDAVYKTYPQVSLQFDKLMKQTKAFFGEYMGVTGVGRFMGGELVEMTITATAEYDSRTEVLQFTQYAAALINQLFDRKVHVNLYVQSIHKPLAIFVRPVEGQPYMHIYRK